MNDQDWYDLLGEYSNEPCPDCGKKILVNKRDHKWCGDCGWLNDPEMTEFFKSLEIDKK